MTESLYDQYQGLGVLETVCVAFFDLVDSTHLKKQMGQLKGVDLALKHNQVAAEVCQRFNGRIIKHIGDSIMVVFKIPLEGILASIEFIQAIHMNQYPFRTKVGLVHGIAKKVDINGLDYLGNTVDRSARLTSQSLPNQILTDETTMDMIKPFLMDFNQLISRFVGMRELKGIGGIPVYELSLESIGFVEEEAIVPEVQFSASNGVTGVISKKAQKAASRVRIELPPLAGQTPVTCEVKDKILGKMLEQWTLKKEDLENIAIGYQNISHTFEKAYDLNIARLAFSGTFARGSMIKPLEPVDLITVMTPPSDQYRDVEETARGLAHVLSQGYPNSITINNNNCIIISLQGIDFLITPVLAVINGGQGQFMVPKGDFWVAANPAIPEQWMEQAVKRNGPTFLPFIRLLKMWQRINCTVLKSFHLELLTDFIASQIKLEISFESIYQWFRYAYNYYGKIKKPYILDPSKSNTYIDEYIFASSPVFKIFSTNITNAFNTAIQGVTYYRSGKKEKSMAKWKELFGEYWLA
ncbi:MAG: Adenylate and Guanylate cyclase catalytic domain protein [Pelotomaculum sp. PtaB.Bin013]|uniref:Adenylate/guanylate cyclase domain-containing protein n=1 Tax=Pelotomaculum isophthalicicum JI TaxID=947010 RepID=A0A9X4H4E3_9FIRM|nr:adenylate/guanylate cyclase domain-containing protein [Pelotomaculum isophthalicicum]MDF9407223.1 adenylate/guanylate cyclase domain-containing protein [Pelotomaculum isophthalicicum JI]OPX88444.1 MAG: Adenylate and Guanylate cyclase catalytic domain protein [Pelotomaculum sp. PtaB.Bin013]